MYVLIAGSYKKSNMADMADVPENAPERKHELCFVFRDFNQFDQWVFVTWLNFFSSHWQTAQEREVNRLEKAVRVKVVQIKVFVPLANQ